MINKRCHTFVSEFGQNAPDVLRLIVRLAPVSSFVHLHPHGWEEVELPLRQGGRVVFGSPWWLVAERHLLQHGRNLAPACRSALVSFRICSGARQNVPILLLVLSGDAEQEAEAEGALWQRPGSARTVSSDHFGVVTCFSEGFPQHTGPQLESWERRAGLRFSGSWTWLRFSRVVFWTGLSFGQVRGFSDVHFCSICRHSRGWKCSRSGQIPVQQPLFVLVGESELFLCV